MGNEIKTYRQLLMGAGVSEAWKVIRDFKKQGISEKQLDDAVAVHTRIGTVSKSEAFVKALKENEFAQKHAQALQRMMQRKTDCHAVKPSPRHRIVEIQPQKNGNETKMWAIAHAIKKMAYSPYDKGCMITYVIPMFDQLIDMKGWKAIEFAVKSGWCAATALANTYLNRLQTPQTNNAKANALAKAVTLFTGNNESSENVRRTLFRQLVDMKAWEAIAWIFSSARCEDSPMSYTYNSPSCRILGASLSSVLQENKPPTTPEKTRDIAQEK